METLGIIVLAVFAMALRLYVRHLISEALWGPSGDRWEAEAQRLDDEDMFSRIGRG